MEDSMKGIHINLPVAPLAFPTSRNVVNQLLEFLFHQKVEHVYLLSWCGLGDSTSSS
jgi:hypothetical protein